MNDKQKAAYHHYGKILRRAYYKSTVYLRMLTATKRVLPDYIIAGAQKAGTGSLHLNLLQHPNILPPYQKREIHYWDVPQDYHKGLLWYRAHFPLLQEVKAASAITGEKTPNYFEKPEYIIRIKEDIPTVKLIVLLRNPVERTISNYFKEKRQGNEELPIMDSLLSEEVRLANPVEQKRYGTRRAYKMRSIYPPSVKACLDYFPPEQICFLDSYSFFKDPLSTLKDLYNFLGVSTDHEPEIIYHKNRGDYDEKNIPQEVYTYLRNYFRPYNEELYTLLGRDFGWDKKYPEK